MVIINVENWLISVFIQCSCSNIPVDREKTVKLQQPKNMTRIKTRQRYLHRASLHDARHDDDDDDNDVHACVHLHIVTLFPIFTLTSFSCKLSQNCPSSACPSPAVLVAPVPVPLYQFRMSQNRCPSSACPRTAVPVPHVPVPRVPIPAICILLMVVCRSGCGIVAKWLNEWVMYAEESGEFLWKKSKLTCRKIRVQDMERPKLKHLLSIQVKHGKNMDSPTACANCTMPTTAKYNHWAAWTTHVGSFTDGCTCVKVYVVLWQNGWVNPLWCWLDAE